ncbi:MAG: alpha-ketoglutarate-dependent dioxygenase AlkB, partial [Okeania sp. SIO2H7]|nr:alpha-ketoglutarate-dependent dioxygenase AlkB [Okeania sp. SIO2H7]
MDVTINLPPVTEETGGAYEVREIRLNGQVITSEIAESMLSDRNTIEVDLSEGNTEASPLNVVANLEDYRYRFAPFPPTVDEITAVGDRLEIRFHLDKENPDEVIINIYRDGELVAKGLSGHSTTWRDPDSAGINSPSYCYNLETTYINSGTTSQRSAPFCYWGVDYNRIYEVNAENNTETFSAIGGNFSYDWGRGHFDNWGKPGDSITAKIQAKFNGRHAIQAVAGNGSGPINTGITCAVKRLEMRDLENETIVAEGYLIMPQLGTSDRWLESSV